MNTEAAQSGLPPLAPTLCISQLFSQVRKARCALMQVSCLVIKLAQPLASLLQGCARLARCVMSPRRL
eukprot:CAMPEP_0202873858 /NCGR_PEP_ID=MMETSP1391-20130828/24173_1 /ASSEMBLY_ACC=CAM_ASM_000867 /TAXON_ID=1034604 /ORGANISM="Chlamydomonas leiostraca, Strain SAG 11-49" /LENGTH=67 /DNA_ID=CAMNT_0049555167 /DNA_START=173 /DNA_END=373 /DNA_ORIENTATION=-